MPLTRRSVLQTLGGLAGTLAAGGPGSLAWSNEKPTVVVVGSGIAGLSTAWDLGKAGYDVTVLEKDEMAGGRMIQTWVGPRYINPHAGGVFSENREMFALADEVSVSLAGSRGYDESPVDNGHGVYNHALRFRLEEIAAIPGLSNETRRKLPLLLPDLEEIAVAVDPCLLTSGKAWDDETLLEYYVRKLGRDSAREIVDYWVDPVLDAWGAGPDETSRIPLLAWFARQDAGFVVPEAGIGVLTAALGERLDVRLNCTVSSISPPAADGRRTVHFIDEAGQRRSLTPHIVVCAVEGKYTPYLVSDLTPAQRSLTDEIFFTKYACVTYVLKPEHGPDAFTMGRYIPSHPDPQKRRLFMWFATPADPTVRGSPPTVEVWPARREIPRWIDSGKTLPAYCMKLMEPVYPGLEWSMVDDIVVLGGDDLFYAPTGFIHKMDAVVREQASSRRSLYLVGDYLGAQHTGGACASGRTTARAILRHWA